MSTSRHYVIIYHITRDVPGKNLKGHVLLFVPITSFVENETTFKKYYYPFEMFLTELNTCRQQYAYNGELNFAKISGRIWEKRDYVYQKAVFLAVDALRSKSPEIFPHPLNFKVATIFYPQGADWNIYGGNSCEEQKLRHDETLLRILLKGACHYLYDDSNPVEVVEMVSDGEPAHRKLDEDRIFWRLTYDNFYGRSSLRDYVTFYSDACIIHLPSDHKKHWRDTKDYMHANFLQIADLLLGTVIRAFYVGIKTVKISLKIGEKCAKRDVIAQPVKEMLKYSGHDRSFVITQVTFTEGEINFQEVPVAQIQDENYLQMPLLDKNSMV